jgi:hypothetical protein
MIGLKKSQTRFLHWAFLLSLLCLATCSAWALDASKPPSNNFDLTHWKLTLPDVNASEIKAAQLSHGYTNAAFFYSGPDGGMTFYCPTKGGTTSGSDFPRCELRELLNPADDNVNWTGYGTHVLNARCVVSQLPGTKKVIIGQIHGFAPNANPLIKLQFNDGIIEALVKADGVKDTKLNFMNLGLNKTVTYQIKVVDGLLSVDVNGSNQSVNIFQTNPGWKTNTFYFKAGNYCQDNSKKGSAGAKVTFYSLAVNHPKNSTSAR